MSDRSPKIGIRPAGSADADRIAALHVASWRTAYRGILLDGFLDDALEADRRALWRGRLTDPAPNQVLLVAETAGALAGFVCCFVDQDPHWGSYVHNLHADPSLRGRSIGRTLMHALAEELEHRAPARPVHLFCLAANTSARRFYQRIGGEIGDHRDLSEPDGRTYPCLLYAWTSPARLAGGAAAG